MSDVYKYHVVLTCSCLDIDLRIVFVFAMFCCLGDTQHTVCPFMAVTTTSPPLLRLAYYPCRKCVILTSFSGQRLVDTLNNLTNLYLNPQNVAFLILLATPGRCLSSTDYTAPSEQRRFHATRR